MSMANKSVSRETEEPASVLNALSEGSRQTRTLAECLAVDQARLARATLPDAGAEVFRTFDAAARLGILRRMQVEGATLLARYGLKDGLVRCKSHTSDTVRGWGCFIVGASPDRYRGQVVAELIRGNAAAVRGADQGCPIRRDL